MKTVKFAIVGCGRISESHINAIKKAPSASLVAVCDIDEAAAAKAAEDAGLKTYFTDLRTMLENAEIDVLNVCTPSGMHKDHAVIAAQYGVHVLSEKPLDITSAKMDEMIKVCREKNVLLGGIYQRRGAEIVKRVKECVSSGGIGRLLIADVSMKYYRSPEYYKSGDWRGTWELDGGGCLMNQGIHGIDLLMDIAGDIASVTAKCATLDREIDVEDTALAIVNFKNGAMGVIEGATCVTPGQDTVLSLHGTKGSIVFGDKGFYTWRTVDGSEPPELPTGALGGVNCGWAGDTLHALQVEDMAQSIIVGRAPMVPGESARRAVDVILAIYKSSESGTEVSL